MNAFDIEALRAQIRSMVFVRGTPTQVAEWREADAESRANLVIEGMDPESDEDAIFALMLEEAVPLDLVSRIILRLRDHPDADRSLPITPMVVRAPV